MEIGSPQPIQQQVQPQPIGDSTALNSLMASIMQKDQEYKNRLDTTIFTPQYTPQFTTPQKGKIQTTETGTITHEPPMTTTRKEQLPQPYFLNFENVPKEKPSLLKRIFGTRKTNTTPDIQVEKKLLEYKPEITPSPAIETKKTKPTFLKATADFVFGTPRESKIEIEKAVKPVTISNKPPPAPSSKIRAPRI